MGNLNLMDRCQRSLFTIIKKDNKRSEGKKRKAEVTFGIRLETPPRGKIVCCLMQTKLSALPWKWNFTTSFFSVRPESSSDVRGNSIFNLSWILTSFCRHLLRRATRPMEIFKTGVKCDHFPPPSGCKRFFNLRNCSRKEPLRSRIALFLLSLRLALCIHQTSSEAVKLVPLK